MSTYLYDKLQQIPGAVEHLASLIAEQVDQKNELRGFHNIEIMSKFQRDHMFTFKEPLPQQSLFFEMDKIIGRSVQNVVPLKPMVPINNNKVLRKANLVEEYAAFKTAGISIGESNIYHINNSLKVIAEANNTTNIRFWGKILGKLDYYVMQGQTQQKTSATQGDIQPHSQGVNTYTYWVSNHVFGPWIELPVVTPLMVKNSRKFKFIFTGNYNHFILKCVIARITHSTHLVPKGIYRINQQSGSLEFEEQVKLPEVHEVNSADAWVHYNQHILQAGRVTHYINPKLTQQQKEAYITQCNQKDPQVDKLKSIIQDKPYDTLGFTSNWTVQYYGQTTSVNLVGKQEGQTALYGVVLLKNLVWPGAYTIGFRGGWSNLYVGYGHRLSQINNSILQLPDLQIDGKQIAQRPQPNPKIAPKAPQIPVSDQLAPSDPPPTD